MLEQTEQPKERAVAVALNTDSRLREQAQEHLAELDFLAETAGADVIRTLYQERHKPDGATLIGKGKVAELKQMVEEEGVTLIIFDNDLSPAQARNLEKELEVKIMDRTGIILDIFASRAKTVEAKTQVELAQLEYMLPRLTRMWTHLSKQFGGIGTKGPGETQIETDRRLIRDRIVFLKDKLTKIASRLEQQRKGRERMPKFALVGYTNAGKSTLMNTLTGADVYAEDKLFATLDTTVRAVTLSDGKPGLLSDTVGFIRKLPPKLVASFRSTLAETLEADVLLHVIDTSHPAVREHIVSVIDTLRDLGADTKPTIMVFNKVDALTTVEQKELLELLQLEFPQHVAISAKTSYNIPQLIQLMTELGDTGHERFQVFIPYKDMAAIADMYKLAEVLERNDGDEGITLLLSVERRHALEIHRWRERFGVSEEAQHSN